MTFALLSITALFLIGYLATAYYYRIAHRALSLRLSRLEDKTQRLRNTAFDRGVFLDELAVTADQLRRDLDRLQRQVKTRSQVTYHDIGELQARLRHVECILGEKEGRKKARRPGSASFTLQPAPPSKQPANIPTPEKPLSDGPSDEKPN